MTLIAHGLKARPAIMFARPTLPRASIASESGAAVSETPKLEPYQFDGLASIFLPSPGELHNFLYRLVGMKSGHNEAASVRAISHNEFINLVIYLAGIFADDGNQDDAIAGARLYERRQQVRVRHRQLQDDLWSIGHI
jgi:hypothetical protein